MIFEPLDFIARLAALVPRPRVNLTRFHGVFAPNSQHRALITPAGRGTGQKHKVTEQEETRTPAERHAAMTWAQRLKRVFSIDIETCQACGGAVKIMPKALAALAGQALACIEDPGVIRRILDHLDRLAPTTEPDALPEPRAPPQVGCSTPSDRPALPRTDAAVPGPGRVPFDRDLENDRYPSLNHRNVRQIQPTSG